MPARKGQPRPDVALVNKLSKGKKKADRAKIDMEAEALAKFKEMEAEQEAITVALQENGIKVPKGWKPADIITALRIKLEQDLIVDMTLHNAKIMKTHNSAMSANSFTQFILNLLMGDKEDREVPDENKTANIIIFGQGSFQGVGDD